jgi:DNA-binding NtrC family response regulator
MTSAAAIMIERLAKSRPARESTRHSVPLDILVVDDDQATRLSLAYALSDAGHRVVEAEDGEEAIALASERTFDVAVLDVRLPKVDGITIFRRLRTRAPRTAVILMTAFATIHDAVACLREGAYDYVTKPFDPEELTLRVIGHISEHVSLKRELEEARRLVASRDAGSPIVGTTPVMTRLVELVNTIAQSDAPVLVQGETGTGKQLVAHTLHARSPRKSSPFVAFDCAAFPESRIDVELFGGLDGGRIRAADGGTLLLAEVDTLPVTTQAKLLRVLEEGVVQPVAGGEPCPVRVRIVSSTQRDLKQLAREGRFRDDLLFRINVLDLQVPPLRERRADMPLLLAHFLRRFCPGRVPPGIGPRAWDSLMSYPFPGNVRELAQALERAVVLAHGSEIDVEHLPETITTNSAPEEKLEPLSVASKDFEKRHVARALSLAGGDVDRAAELLGVSSRTLRQKRERYRI